MALRGAWRLAAPAVEAVEVLALAFCAEVLAPGAGVEVLAPGVEPLAVPGGELLAAAELLDGEQRAWPIPTMASRATPRAALVPRTTASA